MQTQRFISMRRKAALVIVTGTLAACGGGGGGSGGGATPPPAAPPEAVFVPANQWPGQRPGGATEVTADELRRRVAAGEVRIITPTTRSTAEQQRQQQRAEDLAYLESLTDPSPAVAELLTAIKAPGAALEDADVVLPNGQRIALQGLGARLTEAALAARAVRDPANLRGVYTAAYQALPVDVRAPLPTPEALATASLTVVEAALREANLAAATVVNLDNVRREPGAPLSTVRPFAGPGNGRDNGGTCTPTNFFAAYWFPNKNVMPPIKSQGMRGTCWAFTAVAAIEAHERINNNNPVDLSEQHFVNAVKREFRREDFVDNGSYVFAMEEARKRNYRFVNESFWTYNPSFGRVADAFSTTKSGKSESYQGACIGGVPTAGTAYTGDCGETAHQTEVVCGAQNNLWVCGESIRVDLAASVPSRATLSIWDGNPDKFDLNTLRVLLASGHTLMASFPVYDGFNNTPPAGVLNDYARAANGKANESFGGHAVLIVGFISNEQMSEPGKAPTAFPGGGLFIVRNSWGCGADGGYWYIPADYVRTVFTDIAFMPNFGQRSEAWLRDQNTDPVTLQASAEQTAQLRVPFNVGSLFTATHRVATTVQLTVRSDRNSDGTQGLIYSGQWTIGGGGFNPSTVLHAFQSTGRRNLTITAVYGRNVASAVQAVNVVNSAPVVTIELPQAPQATVPFPLTLRVVDVNEANPDALCTGANFTFFNEGDTLLPGSGCSRQVLFAAAGTRQFRVTLTDSNGTPGSADVTVNVADAPANPFPRVLASGLYSREGIGPTDIFGNRLCGTVPVAAGALIDTRDLGCSQIGLSFPPRYSARVDIENPSGEALSYDWTFRVYPFLQGFAPLENTYSTTTGVLPQFGAILGAADQWLRCEITVRVNAPEPARSKFVNVWSGQCRVVPSTPR